MDRLAIQYGTSFGYPVSAVGSHVSAVPNHQTGRSTPMKTRGVTAMAGSFGYELDLSKITVEEQACVREQIADFHKFWPLIHDGDYYRLSGPSGRTAKRPWPPGNLQPRTKARFWSIWWPWNATATRRTAM